LGPAPAFWRWGNERAVRAQRARPRPGANGRRGVAFPPEADAPLAQAAPAPTAGPMICQRMAKRING
jgi:hypothetical protein